MRYKIGLTLIIVLAGFLRFWRLGRWSFWADEALTLLDARSFPHVLRINPLPYALVRLTTDFFGQDEWGARIGFALVGVLSVWAIYLIASRISNRKVGLISSLFLALLPWHIFWSQNARSYSLVLFWSLFSSGTFYLAFERDSLLLLLTSMFCMAMLVGSHLLSAVLILSFLAYLVLLKLLPMESPKGLRAKNILIFASPIALILLIAFHPKIFSFIVSGWGHNKWARSPIYVAMTLSWGVTVPAAVASIFALVDGLILKRPPSRSTLFLACWAGVPLIFFLIGSLFQNVAGYYLFFTIPAYLILAAQTCEALGRRKVIALVVALLSSEMMVWDYLYFTRENGGRPMWREAFHLVREHMKPGDLIISTIPALAQYYLPEARFAKAEDLMLGKLDWSTEKRVWFILDESNMRVIDPNRRFRDRIAAEGRFVRRFSVYSRAADRSVTVFLIER